MLETSDRQKAQYVSQRDENFLRAAIFRENWAKALGCESFGQATLIGLGRVSRGFVLDPKKDKPKPPQAWETAVLTPDRLEQLLRLLGK